MLAQRSFRHKKGQLNTVSSIMLLGYVCVATFLVLSSEHSLGCRHTEGPLSALATRLNQPNSSRLMAHVEHNAYPRDRLALPVGIDGPPGIGEGMTPAGWIGLRPHMAAAVVTRTGVLAYPATLTPTTTPTATPTETPTPTPLVACARALWPPGIGEDTATAGWRRPWSRVMAAVVARTGILAWPATSPTHTPTATPIETPTSTRLVACAWVLWPSSLDTETSSLPTTQVRPWSRVMADLVTRTGILAWPATPPIPTPGWHRPWSRVVAAVVARTGILTHPATLTPTSTPTATPNPTETLTAAPLVAYARALWPPGIGEDTATAGWRRPWSRVMAAVVARTGILAHPPTLTPTAAPTPTATPTETAAPLVAYARALWPPGIGEDTATARWHRPWSRAVAAVVARTGIPPSPSPVEATLLNTDDDTYNAAGGSVQQHVRHGAGRDPAL